MYVCIILHICTECQGDVSERQSDMSTDTGGEGETVGSHASQGAPKQRQGQFCSLYLYILI